MKKINKKMFKIIILLSAVCFDREVPQEDPLDKPTEECLDRNH